MKKFILVMMAAVMMVPAALAQERAKSHKVQIVAHRGYWNCEEGQNAKNSIASLAAAQKYGFWGSEFDVNMTKATATPEPFILSIEKANIDFGCPEGSKFSPGSKIKQMPVKDSSKVFIETV